VDRSAWGGSSGGRPPEPSPRNARERSTAQSGNMTLTSVLEYDISVSFNTGERGQTGVRCAHRNMTPVSVSKDPANAPRHRARTGATPACGMTELRTSSDEAAPRRRAAHPLPQPGQDLPAVRARAAPMLFTCGVTLDDGSGRHHRKHAPGRPPHAPKMAC
jgi:hypothetical protein